MHSDESGRMVLVVDDFPESVDVLYTMLAERGYTVALALDGEDALRQVRELQPDVVVTDLAMPGVNGLELTRRLKAAPETRDIPVVLFSAHAGPELGAVADQLGCTAVVRKPAGSGAVVDLVSRLCESTAG
jgi:CheY-like chemotaxis protein